MSMRMRWLVLGCVAAGPFLLMLAFLRNIIPDPYVAGPIFHFYIVSLTSLLAIALALLMLVGASQLKDARVLFLGLAFLGMAGIFLVHALTTPGALIPENNPWVGFSSRLSLGVGAFFLGVSTIEWPTRVLRTIARYQTAIVLVFVTLLVAYGAVAMGSSLSASQASTAVPASVVGDSGYGNDYDSYGGYTQTTPADTPLASQAATAPMTTAFDAGITALITPTVSWIVTALTIVLLLLTVFHYAWLYRRSRSPLVAGFLVSGICIFQAEVSMVVAPVWHASWWEYHGLLLAAFSVAIVGLCVEYSQSRSLSGVIEGILLRDTIAQLQRGYTDVIVALIEAVEAKDPYTHGHSRRVAELSVRIGEELKLAPEQLRTLNQAALLHDIGKIGVADAILNKPGRLTPEEFAIVKEHPVRGHQIIRQVRSLRQEISGIRSHHERLDGSGYPDGLVGEEIPLDARIIGVADVYDALSSSRAYRSAWSPEAALAVVDQEAGAKLDPDCVAALRDVLGRRRDLPGRETAGQLAGNPTQS